MKNNESKTDKYDYFDVTADIGFYAYGKSIEEAYENAGLAMFNVITDISKVKKEESREFEIVSDSDFKVNIEKIVDDESSNLENYKLTCFACGEEIDWNVHSPKSEVKAITFHKMCVKEDNGVFKLRAILDL